VVQKSIPNSAYYPDNEDVTIEPRPGYSGREIVQLFQQEGAAPPNELAPGFLSGRVPARLQEKLNTLAVVQTKPRKRMPLVAASAGSLRPN